MGWEPEMDDGPDRETGAVGVLAEDRGFEPLRAFTPNPLSKRAP